MTSYDARATPAYSGAHDWNLWLRLAHTYVGLRMYIDTDDTEHEGITSTPTECERGRQSSTYKNQTFHRHSRRKRAGKASQASALDRSNSIKILQ